VIAASVVAAGTAWVPQAAQIRRAAITARRRQNPAAARELRQPVS
jgi:hypothetical protein